MKVPNKPGKVCISQSLKQQLKNRTKPISESRNGNVLKIIRMLQKKAGSVKTTTKKKI